MKKSILAMSLATVLASTAASAMNDLPAGAVLSIEAGSNFAMGAGAYGTVPLLGEKGLYVGAALGDSGTGSGGGFPAASDVGAATQPWSFFYNTGYDYVNPSLGSGSFGGDTVAGVDMTSWTVTWNNIATIPMGGCFLVAGGCTQNPGQTNEVIFVNSGIGTFTWDGTDGGAYTITYTATVPVGDPSNFGGVQYDLFLTGTVTFDGTPPVNTDTAPVANDDSYAASPDEVGAVLITSAPGAAVRGSITSNDVDNDLNDAPDKTTVILDPLGVTDGPGPTVTTTLGGSATVDAVTGIVTYNAPPGGVIGDDTFQYTIDDIRGSNTSNVATVTVVIGNRAPVCNNDNGIADNMFIDIAVDTEVNLDVLDNDTDPNGNNTIDVTTVNVVDNPANGTFVVEADGTITYTPTPGFLGADTFTYTVSDDGTVPPAILTCVKATATVIVASPGNPIGNVPNAFLVINTGSVGLDVFQQPALGEGSWFSMEVQPGELTHTPVEGFNHIQIGTTQDASSAVPRTPNIDSPWTFFGNLGVHRTTSDLLQLTNDGAGNALLDFSGWNVSWNSIPSIPLNLGDDNGLATLTCYTDLVAGTIAPCEVEGNEFILAYRGRVPDKDPSGFGNVNYTVHFEGTISQTPPLYGCENAVPFDVDTVSVIGDCNTMPVLTLMPGSTATSVGNPTGLYLSASDIGKKDPLLNPNDGQACAGGCLDFVVNTTVGGDALIVVRLNAPIPSGSIYRKLYNGKWQDFDTSTGDQIGSALVDAGTGNCQGAEGEFRIGLRNGYTCLFLKIADGGPNDADGVANGTIVDPSGVLSAGSPNRPASSTDGCSISKTPVKLIERADWLIVAGFLAVMGLVSFKRRSKNNS